LLREDSFSTAFLLDVVTFLSPVAAVAASASNLAHFRLLQLDGEFSVPQAEPVEGKKSRHYSLWKLDRGLRLGDEVESDEMSVRMLGESVFGTKFAPFSLLIHEGLMLTKNEQISEHEEMGDDLRTCSLILVCLSSLVLGSECFAV
jgi:hypothetical protein